MNSLCPSVLMLFRLYFAVFLDSKAKPFNTAGTEVHWVELFLSVFARMTKPGGLKAGEVFGRDLL
jgi:hypothetical protein